ncbi:helix-turn-helix transcriptional regulator [Morganella morganii]
MVGQNIRDLRQHNGLTTTVLAKMLSVSQQQLSRYERGINKIDVSVVFKIINIFHVSYEYLFPEAQNDYTESVKSSFVYMEPLAI